MSNTVLLAVLVLAATGAQSQIFTQFFRPGNGPLSQVLLPWLENNSQNMQQLPVAVANGISQGLNAFQNLMQQQQQQQTPFLPFFSALSPAELFGRPSASVQQRPPTVPSAVPSGFPTVPVQIPQFTIPATFAGETPLPGSGIIAGTNN